MVELGHLFHLNRDHYNLDLLPQILRLDENVIDLKNEILKKREFLSFVSVLSSSKLWI